MTPATAPWRSWPRGQMIRIPDIRATGKVRRVWPSERPSQDIITIDLDDGRDMISLPEKVVKVEAVNG